MQTKRPLSGAAALLLAVALAGCSSTKLDDAPVESRNVPTAGAGSGGAGAGGTAQSNVATVDLAKQNADAARAAALAQRTVYFDFDSFVVRDDFLALGQKRAEAVLRTMVLLGAPEAQLEAVSFGEERPAVQGSGEDAWAKNRRVELRDR